MQKRAAEIGIVLGLVFVIIGFAYGNSGVWILGFIFLALGVAARGSIGRGKQE
jgi:hypothetical protein